jgi:hypothetical protein
LIDRQRRTWLRSHPLQNMKETSNRKPPAAR